jgi:hypothetical protein
MEQLTQAAINYSKKLNPGGSIDILEQSAFKAGAEWQKEQYKTILNELLPIINEALVVCGIEGQDDIIERAESFIERLQTL